MKKFFITFLLVLFICGTLTLPAFAQEEQDLSPTEETILPEAEEGTDSTLSGAVLEFLEQNGNDICQYLSLALSVLLAWLFKKGVLPSLSGGVSHISKTLEGGLSALTEEGKQLAKTTEANLQTFVEAATPALELLSQGADHLQNTETVLKEMANELAAAKQDRLHTSTVLAAQMELFYQFFMAVNLPQYQKEQLGERYVQLMRLVEAEHEADA